MCVMGATPMLRNNGTESHREAIEHKGPYDPLWKTLMTKKTKTPLTELNGPAHVAFFYLKPHKLICPPITYNLSLYFIV